MENIWLAIIAASTGIISPILLAAITAWSRSREKREDWARLDLVAEKAAANNERMASAAVGADGKLNLIHAQVNRNLTSAVRAELDIRRAQLILMLELVDLKKVATQQGPAEETLAEIEGIRSKIIELEKALEERNVQQVQLDRVAAKKHQLPPL